MFSKNTTENFLNKKINKYNKKSWNKQRFKNNDNKQWDKRYCESNYVFRKYRNFIKREYQKS